MLGFAALAAAPLAGEDEAGTGGVAFQSTPQLFGDELLGRLYGKEADANLEGDIRAK